MKLKSIVAAAMAVGVLAMATLPASASTSFNFSFTGAGISGSGVMTGDYNPVDQYVLTNITGNVNGDTITTLSSYADSDNILFYPPTSNFVSFGGISFATVGGFLWNIWSDGAAYIGIFNNGGFGGCDGSVYCATGTQITMDISQVPLPASLPLLAFAFGGLGFLAWRRGQRANASTSGGTMISV